MSVTSHRAKRFSRPPISQRARDAEAVGVIGAIATAAVAAVALDSAPLMLFAVGAGAGYSLSGSV